MQEYFKIGEISKLYNIGVDSLRYYEKIGILKPERTESGYRHYSIQDIWKLNIIRDLRELDFSMEQIRRYLENHSICSTLELLREEQQAIDEKIHYLQNLRDNVQQRMESIQAAEKRPLNEIVMETHPERRCYCIPEEYSDEHEMDVLIKRLLNMDREHLYVIGNNQIGTAISMEDARKSGKIRNKAVFIIDEKGEKVLEAGTYLSVTYRGDYDQSRDWARKILRYAEQRNIRLKGDILELLWVDIHTSADISEHITELQVLTEQ